MAVSLLAATPLLYVVLRALSASGDVWARLWLGQAPLLFTNTVALCLSTIGFATVIGMALAWLVERTNLPCRSLWRWALALPLAGPAYVVAACYIILLRRGGLLDEWVMHLTGAAQAQVPLPNIYGLGGATLVIGLCIFPYVFLLASAALRTMNRTWEEAARTSGRSAWQTFRAVTVPMLMPSVMAGVLLVGLYVLSDFGTVAMLRYQTFTTAIYSQFAGQVDRSGASILSAVLIVMTLPLLWAEAGLTRRGQRYSTNTLWRPQQALALGRWRWPALGFVCLVALLALGVPLAVLGGLSVQAWLSPTDADRIWSVGGEGIWGYGLNSLVLAVLAATLSTMLAFAPTHLAVRNPGRLAQTLLGLTKTAYALPGLIVGLGFVMIFNQWLPAIYGTLSMLVLGFAFRLLPQSVATSEAALKSVSPSLEAAARVMGCSGWTAFWRVTLPVATPGLLASWALVFITAMKELPTAILLRPPGFDTLPVRIWAAASESVYTQAAPPAFLLVVLTMAPLILLYSRHGVGVERVLHDRV
ncbi:MAG: iron ABC transporter permease [Chloroflexi bacterium]|nr:iron ABC transporter permease [Chloroflexota bacterium]